MQQGVLKVKKTLILSTIVAALVILIAYACPVTAQAPPQSGGTSVVVIDIPYIFSHHVRFKQTMDAMQKSVTEWEGYFKAEQQKITDLRESLKEYTIGSADYKRVEEQMAHMQSDLQVKATLKRKEFMEQEARAYYNAYKEIEYQVTNFAQRHGIGLVLRYSSTEMDPQKLDTIRQGLMRSVVYHQNLDITQHIIEQLNQGTAPANTAGRPAYPRAASGNRGGTH